VKSVVGRSSIDLFVILRCVRNVAREKHKHNQRQLVGPSTSWQEAQLSLGKVDRTAYVRDVSLRYVSVQAMLTKRCLKSYNKR